jgi:hypothetical protein
MWDAEPITNGEQVVTHQPAKSFTISFQHPFNRAGGRTSNVRRQRIMSRFILNKVARVVEGTDKTFRHVFGGKLKHKGITAMTR